MESTRGDSGGARVPDEFGDKGLTRRGMLAVAASVGIGIGLIGRTFEGCDGREESAGDSQAAVDFYGPHQAGIVTPPPKYVNVATFDLVSDHANELRSLLMEWTVVASVITKGERYQRGDSQAAVLDPGEAVGFSPAQLTTTFGFGPSLFAQGRREALGLAEHRASALAPLPSFPGDSLEPARSGGDLCIQACAEDPQVAFHAIHMFTRIASGIAILRWSQQGFGRTSITSRHQPTRRNLMGFKDGTNNVRAEDQGDMHKYVWVQPGDGPAWMEGGTYMVVRRIQMLLDVWDATSVDGQERAVGREKVSGAPLGQEQEYDPVDLEAMRDGELAIPTDAHIRLASPDLNGGQRILRRGFSYTEPSRAGSGQLDAGLFFISFQRDPQRQFVPIQRRLAANDALSRHLLHTGSGVFACPPGVQPGGFIGEGLFA